MLRATSRATSLCLPPRVCTPRLAGELKGPGHVPVRFVATPVWVQPLSASAFRMHRHVFNVDFSIAERRHRSQLA